MVTATRPPAAPGGRLQTLDILRGIAILLVLGHHTPEPPWDLPAVLTVALGRWQLAGWAGVDLFFVLSGFLVSGLLFSEFRREGSVDVARFLVRRGLKIYPAYYVLLTVSLIVGGRAAVSGVIHDALFLSGYLQPYWGHAWTLAVEEHFYFLLVIAAWWAVRRRPSDATGDPFASVPRIVITIIALELAARIVTVSLSPVPWLWRTGKTHLRLDGLAFGVLLSYWYHFHRPALTAAVHRLQGPIVLAAAGLLAPALVLHVYDPVMQTVGITALFLGFGGLLVVAVLVPSPLPRPAGWLADRVAWLGTYSYSVYLWHYAVLRWGTTVSRWITGRPIGPHAALAVYFIGSIVVGVAMAKLIEMPVLALRDRWMPSRAGATRPAPPRPVPIPA